MFVMIAMHFKAPLYFRNWTFGNWTIGNWTFGNRYFGNWTFGNRYFGNWTFGNRYVGNWTFGNRYFGNWTFGNRYFGNQCNLAMNDIYCKNRWITQLFFSNADICKPNDTLFVLSEFVANP